MDTSLPVGSILIYTDGPRSFEGNTRADCVGFEKDKGEMRMFEGHCFPGRQMEVYGAEIHAVKENLLALIPQSYIYREMATGIRIRGYKLEISDRVGTLVIPESQSLFQDLLLADRYYIDPRHENEAKKCRYGIADPTSDHIIGMCPLFDYSRS
jgi:hypothetical protein